MSRVGFNRSIRRTTATDEGNFWNSFCIRRGGSHGSSLTNRATHEGLAFPDCEKGIASFFSAFNDHAYPDLGARLIVEIP
jgi:hypothetical protein